MGKRTSATSWTSSPPAKKSLDSATLEVCIVAARDAGCMNGAEEAGRASVVRALEALRDR